MMTPEQREALDIKRRTADFFERYTNMLAGVLHSVESPGTQPLGQDVSSSSQPLEFDFPSVSSSVPTGLLAGNIQLIRQLQEKNAKSKVQLREANDRVQRGERMIDTLLKQGRQSRL